MLICTVCGEVFDEFEAKRSEGRTICPYCGYDIIHEATKCEICGEYFYAETDSIEVCNVCLKDECSVGTALEYGADRVESVAINGAIYSLLSEEEINAILTKYVEEHFTDKSKEIIRYCEEDKQDFADWLVERLG